MNTSNRKSPMKRSKYKYNKRQSIDWHINNTSNSNDRSSNDRSSNATNSNRK